MLRKLLTKLTSALENYHRKKLERSRIPSPSSPIPPAANREDRKRHRHNWQFIRSHGDCAPKGCPGLSGARLERTINQCSPKHLTVLSRGSKRHFNAEFSVTI
jgi:hypothetical protein